MSVVLSFLPVSKSVCLDMRDLAFAHGRGLLLAMRHDCLLRHQVVHPLPARATPRWVRRHVGAVPGALAAGRPRCAVVAPVAKVLAASVAASTTSAAASIASSAALVAAPAPLVPRSLAAVELLSTSSRPPHADPTQGALCRRRVATSVCGLAPLA